MLRVSPRAEPVENSAQHENTHISSTSAGLRVSAPTHLERGLAGLQLSPQLADLLGGGLPDAAQAAVQRLHVLRQLQHLALLGAELHLQVGARQHLQGPLLRGGDMRSVRRGSSGGGSEHKCLELAVQGGGEIASADMDVFLCYQYRLKKKHLEVMHVEIQCRRWMVEKRSGLDRTWRRCHPPLVAPSI